MPKRRKARGSRVQSLATCTVNRKYTWPYSGLLVGTDPVAVDATGLPLPQATIEACQAADAALLGAVGGPQWDGHPAEQRPELGLLQIRSALNLFCNLRPVVLHPSLQHFSPLKPDRLVNVDLMIVRELTGGSYFGKKWRDDEQAEDVCRYTRDEVLRVTRAAAAISGSLVETMTRLSRLDSRATSTAHSISGLPPRQARFLWGIPFEPPRAVMTPSV